MKKFLFTFLIVFTALSSFAAHKNDRSGTINGFGAWNYDFKSKTLIVSGTGEMPNYGYSSNKAPWLTEVMASTTGEVYDPILDEYITTVTNFYLRDYIEYIVLNDQITLIGANSFVNLTKVKTITINAPINTISSNAFLGCSNVVSLNWTITGDVQIDPAAFDGCDNIVSNNCFYHDDCLVKVFDAYTSTSLNINAGTEKILPSAVKGMKKLTSITIPSSVKTIGYDAFKGCTGLTSITIPSSVTSIGADAFDGCSNLTTVTFNANVKTFGNWFEGLSKLTTINIPASVTTISNNAFNGCTSLTNVTFGKVSNITTWGSNIFSGVTGKTDADGNYKMIGNSIILKAISNSAPDARYEIKSNVAYIADNAFADVNNSTVYLDLRGRDNAPVLASSALNGIAGFKTIVKNDKEGNFNSKVWSNINTTTIEVPSEKYTTCMFMYNAVVPEGIAVYTAKSNAEGKVVLTKINKNNARTVVPAGVGFMLRADNKTTATFVSAKSEAAVSVNENELKGAEDYTYFTGDENPYVYILSTVDGKQGFYRAGSTNKLKIGKAYLQSNTQIHSLAKMSLWEGESETSGISNAQMSENSNAKGYVYNLNGSRMSSPQKGVNIINGKKVIIK